MMASALQQVLQTSVIHTVIFMILVMSRTSCTVDSLHTGEFMEAVTETIICSRLQGNNYRHNELQASPSCPSNLCSRIVSRIPCGKVWWR